MWYWIFRCIFRIIGRLFFRLKVVGVENIPQKTNFIIVANHTSFLDPIVVMAGVPKKIYCLALRFLYRMFLIGWFLKKVEALPVGSASSRAISLLQQNKNVGLFPEGRISRSGKLLDFRRGAALLAYKTGRPIVPCAILGTFEALPLGKVLPRLYPITLRIGKPIYLLKEFEDVIDDIKLQDGTNRIRNAIKEMLDVGR